MKERIRIRIAVDWDDSTLADTELELPSSFSYGFPAIPDDDGSDDFRSQQDIIATVQPAHPLS